MHSLSLHTAYAFAASWFLALMCGNGLAAEEPAAAPAASTAEKPAADEGEKPAEGKEKNAAAASKPLTVQRGPFKVELTLEAVFEALQTTEVSLAPREFADFTVVKAVEHGARVKLGEPLITFDTRKLDHEIMELEAGRDLARRAWEQAENDARVSAEMSPLELHVAQQTQVESQEDLNYFLKIGRSASEQTAQYLEKYATAALEGAKEELKQLEKMYKADDITEETEEIILKRARQDVEFAQHRFDMAKIEREQALAYEIPRAEKGLQLAAKLKALARQKAELVLPGELQQKRLAAAKARFDLQQEEEKLARLKADRELMVIKAPAAGVAFHGQAVRGKWSSAALENVLNGGGRAAAYETLITIVSPGEMAVRAVVPAKQYTRIKKNLAGVVSPAGRHDIKLAAKVAELSLAPAADGAFDARLTLEEPLAAGLTPGLACSAKFRLYTKTDAISVPTKAVQTDELDDDKRYVFVVQDDESHERRDVVVGHASDDRVEITSGLEEGDRILSEKPDDE